MDIFSVDAGDDSIDAGDSSPLDRAVPWCDALGYRWSASDSCDPTCDAIDCGCVVLPTCRDRGCLEAASCDAVCDDVESAFRCFYFDEGPCESDDDCSAGRCLRDGAHSQCDDGSPGSPCVDDLDCADNRCVAHVCSEGGLWSECLQGDDCREGYTCRTADGEPIGRCSNGNPWAPCGSASDCSGLDCVFTDPSSGFGLCSSRDDSFPCASAQDCLPDYYCVAEGSCWNGTTGDVCDTDEQCQDQMCLDSPLGGKRCSDGAPYSPCMSSTDCNGGFCVMSDPNNLGEYSTYCDTGEVGAFCGSDDHCLVGHCTIRESDVFGYCTTGAAGEPCEVDEECVDGSAPFCVGPDPGACGAGAPGDACTENADCASGDCVGVCN